MTKNALLHSVTLPTLLASAWFALPCNAAEPVILGNPNPSVEELMRARPGSAGVFVPQPDETIRHVQSGFVCPDRLPNVNFWSLLITPSPLGPGNDVGCDYGRMKDGKTANGAETKFSIVIAKAQPGTTLDDAFKRYQADMHRAFPNWKLKGPVIGPDSIRVRRSDGTPVALPEFQSEADDVMVDNRPFISELVVGVFGGWIVQLRTSYPQLTGDDRANGVDRPASTYVWATSVREFAEMIQGATR